jgi:hypothetical protein
MAGFELAGLIGRLDGDGNHLDSNGSYVCGLFRPLVAGFEIKSGRTFHFQMVSCLGQSSTSIRWESTELHIRLGSRVSARWGTTSAGAFFGIAKSQWPTLNVIQMEQTPV